MIKEKHSELLRTGARILTYTNYTVSCKKEFLEKNKEYGQSWLIYRPISLLTRIWNKMVRIRSIQEKKSQLIPDSIVSEFDASYNYCMIALIVIDRLRSDQANIISSTDIEGIDSLEELYTEAGNKTFELFKKKDHDYNGAWVEMHISTIVDEMMVKLLRAKQTLQRQQELPVEEFKSGLSEIFMDIANYSIFASILIKELEKDPLS